MPVLTRRRVRAEFAVAWREFLPKRSEADFQAWRDQQTWTREVRALRSRRTDADRLDKPMRCPVCEDGRQAYENHPDQPSNVRQETPRAPSRRVNSATDFP
jgi:hypothetical protein